MEMRYYNSPETERIHFFWEAVKTTTSPRRFENGEFGLFYGVPQIPRRGARMGAVESQKVVIISIRWRWLVKFWLMGDTPMKVGRRRHRLIDQAGAIYPRRVEDASKWPTTANMMV